MARLPFWAPEARAAHNGCWPEVLSGRAKEVAPSWSLLASLAWNWTELRGWRWQREQMCQLQQRKDFFLRGLTSGPKIWWCVSSSLFRGWEGELADQLMCITRPGPQCVTSGSVPGHLLAPVRSTSFLTTREHTKHFPLWPGHVFVLPALSLPLASLWSLKYLLCDYWRITLHSVSWEHGEKKIALEILLSEHKLESLKT